MRSLSQQLGATRRAKREPSAPDLLGLTAVNIGRVSVRRVWESQLLTNQVANTNGVWTSVDRVYPMVMQIAGITTAEVEVRVSLQPTSPAAADHQIQAGLTITADGMVTLDYPVRWVKLRVLNYVAGTINGYGWGLRTF